jgi:uncharacterized protein (TIGR00730 family)
MAPSNKTKPFSSAKAEVKKLPAHTRATAKRLPAYELAFLDQDFLLRKSLRSVRLQLELLKPELIQQDEHIESTVVIFGSARISEKNRYYEQARKLSEIISRESQKTKVRHFVIVTGGGPGIMEAANRGAYDAGKKSIGHSIVLPGTNECVPNAYISPELCFQFHYFAIRKMHFLIRARAAVFFPGGFGTLDELFETLTLLQTGKIKPLPILLFGKEYWSRLINFDVMVNEGMILAEDLLLFRFVESPAEAWQVIKNFYKSSKKKSS